jgi:cbb3-type cytochrome oxidase cytochrome c subunit
MHCFHAHFLSMRKVTLRADESLIEQARLVARAQHKTLNAAFREWLERYAAKSGSVQEVDALLEGLSHVRPGRRFTRDEMNDR